jgi:hypothetical protein
VGKSDSRYARLLVIVIIAQRVGILSAGCSDAHFEGSPPTSVAEIPMRISPCSFQT